MKLTKKIFLRLSKVFFWLVILLLLLPLLLYLPLLYDKNFYKNILEENVANYTPYQLTLDSLDLNVYPSLKVELSLIDLKTKETKIQLIKLDKIIVSIFVPKLLFLGKLQFDEISSSTGMVDVNSILENLPKSEEKEKVPEEESSVDIIQLIDTRLRIVKLELSNIEFKIKKFSSKLENDLLLSKLNIKYESFRDTSIIIQLGFGKLNLDLAGNGGISPERFDPKTINLILQINLTEAWLNEFSNFFKLPNGIFANSSKVDLKLDINKSKESPEINSKFAIQLNSIGFKQKEGGTKFVGPIQLSGEVLYPLYTKNIQTTNLTLVIPNYFHIVTNSNLDFSNGFHGRINANSNYIYITPILKLTETFSSNDTKVEKPNVEAKKTSTNLNMNLNLNYNIGLISYDKYKLHNFYLNTNVQNSEIEFRAGLPKIAFGNLLVKGNASIKNGFEVKGNIEAEDINLENLTKEFLGKKLAEGKLFTSIRFETGDQVGDKDIVKNLLLSGTTTLKDGILLDQADILYPVRFLNKLIPEKEKFNSNISRFNSIEIDYLIKNNNIRVTSLDMQGKVFNANGFARVGLENPSNDIDAKLTVSASLAGGGLKIPMNYNPSEYVPFSIDKVWLGSVYAGMIFGGPMGAMIGSMLSENANMTIQKIQNKAKTTIDEKGKNLLE
ncbi:MAG: hypothetical protein SFU98_04070 [Leptospiraceae bacterium]|nr:hypothetical protein [Leptospiraceae bacterium]